MITDKFNRPFRDLRISVTDRCNFRCTYCMPAEIYGERYQFLHKDDLLTFQEITRLARILVGMGGLKVRLTGGEPLVRNEVETLVAMLSGLRQISDLTMTTNAYLLPQKARRAERRRSAEADREPGYPGRRYLQEDERQGLRD